MVPHREARRAVPPTPLRSATSERYLPPSPTADRYTARGLWASFWLEERSEDAQEFGGDLLITGIIGMKAIGQITQTDSSI